MFDIKLEDMTATVFTESKMYNTLTAANVGLDNSGIIKGSGEYSYLEAVGVILKIDAVIASCPKYLKKRVIATRSQFTNAFGPEMEAVVGPVPS